MLAAALALVIFRNLAYLTFDSLHFDSDQAIVGLMAKHLAEGRAVPLFFYGQAYMLAIEAWVMVPFFWIAGPTVGALRASILSWNLLAAALLVVGLERWGGLRPRHALVASLFFVLAAPAVAARLIEAQGGIIEPFVYVTLAWALRNRPAWLGLVLGIGFLNREFTLYAVPALMASPIIGGRFSRAFVRNWLVTAVAFVAIWEVVDALKPFADLAGPGTRGELLGGFAGSQLDNLLARADWRLATLPSRLAGVGGAAMAWIVGGGLVETTPAAAGRSWMAWLLGAGAGAVTVRIGLLLLGDDAGPRPGSGGWREAHRTAVLRARPAAFAWYLLGVGLVSTLAFAAARPALEGYTRYVVLGILAPAGLTAVFLALEPRAWLRTAVALVVVGWASIAALDHGRMLAAYAAAPPPEYERQLADGLVARGVTVAEAPYWRAYEVTFLARERVKVASTDVARISEYQRLAASASVRVAISDAPCPGGERVAIYYLCRPAP